jgi:hypothetical protein
MSYASRAFAASALISSCVLATSQTALAQDGDGVGVELSAHGAAVLPLGDWGERSGVSVGAWAMARYPLEIGGLGARARLGFLYGIPRQGVLTFMDGTELVLEENTTAIPLLLGVDYLTPVDALSAHVEVGFASLTYAARARSTGDALQLGSTITAPIVNLGASYDLGVARVGLDVLLMNLGGDPLYPGIMLTVGLPLITI